MLIIFGLRVVFHTVGQGTFHCPNCGGDRQYRLRAGRHWFTLFFIPVIPLNKVKGDHVQCATCRTRYRLGVLEQPTAAQMQAALPAGLRAAAAAMLRAGDPGSAVARARAIQAIVAAGAAGYDDAALAEDLSRAYGPAGADLARVGAQLAVPAREWFLAEVVRIGMADGPLTDAEREAAQEIGAGLGMTRAQSIGVIALTEQAAASE